MLSVLGVLVLGLSVAIDPDRIQAFDSNWLVRMDELHAPWALAVSHAMNVLGAGLWGGLIIPLAIVAAFVIARRPWDALIVAASAGITAGAVQLVKHLVGRARPEEMLVTSDYGSFPSGHSAHAVALGVATALVLGRVWMRALAALWAITMMWSRTYLLVHWLSDTVGGALIGLAVACLLWWGVRHLQIRIANRHPVAA